MARPRKGEEKDRPRHLGFRVATWVYDGVQRLATEKGMPASEVAHDLLEIALGRLGIKPEPRSAEGRASATRTKSPPKPRRGSPRKSGLRDGSQTRYE
jgi:hypothetical protein